MRARTLYLLFALVLISLFGTGTAMAQTYPDHSVLASGTWFKIGIADDGVYRIDASDIPSLAGVRTDRIALYGTHGGMLDETNNGIRENDVKPIAISIADQNNNGTFDSDDYLLFYAEGADAWLYNADDQRFEHQRHVYASRNFYFLTTTAQANRLIPSSPTLSANASVITQGTVCGVVDNDLVNVNATGRLWMGEKFTSALTHRTIAVSMPNPMAGTPLKVRYGLASISNDNSRFTVSYNGANRVHNFSRANHHSTFLEEFSAGNGTSFDIDYACSESSAAGYLDFIEVNATASLSMAGGAFLFHNSLNLSNGAISTFQIGQATANTRVWNISRLDSIVSMRVSLSGSTLTFNDITEVPGVYYAFNINSALRVASVDSLICQDIHGSENPDMVIVCHPKFLSQARQIANLHSVLDGLNVLTVTDLEVYNEFSSGKQDPIAIREMLRMFKHRSVSNASLPNPRYLLIFGKGTYDSRNLLGSSLPTVVNFETEDSFDTESNSYASDDIFGYLDNGERLSGSLDVGIGRLPAKSTDEANLLTNKIERYMTRSDLSSESIRGDWRNYVALLSDDADPSCAGDTDFVVSSEYLARRIENQFPQYNIDKLYADSYRQQSGATGSFYPDLNNALKQRLDYGCLLLNYIGHGSAKYIGTERYMEATDIENYANHDQLTFFVTSTCSFGHYDDTAGASGAEAFVLAPAAGIGCIAASRAISHNAAFNTDLCLQALTPGNTVGDALRIAKNHTSVSRSITLFGDPAIRLSIPENQVVVTQINGRAVADGQNDTAEVLTQVTVEGEIRDAQGALVGDFDGLIYPLVFDRAVTTHTLANDNEETEVEFTLQKSMLYKGCEPVSNGRFSYSFIVPRDVAYQYDYGKLSHYARNASADATGAYKQILFGGFNQNADLSESRPLVRLFVNDSNFRSGGITDENPYLFAILEDSLGINAFGNGLGHDITAVLDNNPNNIILLNDFYQTDISNSHRGYVNYQLEGLSAGRHTLSIKAWNIYNYSNSDSISFIVSNSSESVVDNFYAYPNPANESTSLRFELNFADSVQSVSIGIYDMMGRKVKSIDTQANNRSYVVGPINWDFTSDNGTPLPHGIYVARALVYTSAKKPYAVSTKIVKIK